MMDCSGGTLAEDFTTGVFSMCEGWNDERTAAYALVQTTLLNGVIVQITYLLNDGMMGAWWSPYTGLYLRYDAVRECVEYIVTPDGVEPSVEHTWSRYEEADDETEGWVELVDAAEDANAEAAFYALRQLTSSYLRIGPLTPARRRKLEERIRLEDPRRDGLLEQFVAEHSIHTFSRSR